MPKPQMFINKGEGSVITKSIGDLLRMRNLLSRNNTRGSEYRAEI